MGLLWIISVGLVLFLLIDYAIRVEVRKALSEFKDELIKELRLKELAERQSSENMTDNNQAVTPSEDFGQAEIIHRNIE